MCTSCCNLIQQSRHKPKLKKFIQTAPPSPVHLDHHPPALASSVIPVTPNLAYIDTAASHVLLHNKQKQVQSTKHRPLAVKFANGTQASSIGSGILPAGPVTVPVSILDPTNLTHQLLGVAPFTNVGCTAYFDNTTALITKNGHTVLTGFKQPHDTLWTVDLDQLPSNGQANLAIRSQSVQERVNYFQCLFGNRPLSSMVKALTNNYIRDVEGWPTVTPSQYQTHARNIPAIAIGHLQEQRKHIASTRLLPTPSLITPIIDSTPDSERDHNPEVPHIWLRRVDNAIHADAKSLPPLHHDARYLMHFVFNNYHHVEMCSSVDGSDTADAYKKGLEFFESKGHLIDFIRIDNVTSPHLRLLLLRRLMDNKPLKLEYVNVGDHRRNKAEKGIQLMERAFLSTVATMDPSFPQHRRLAIMQQVEITVNHLIPWSPNNLVSAWHGLHGHRYDFNAHPFTIAGCLVSRHIDKSKNQSKGTPKASRAWAVGPALNHYRNYRILAQEGSRNYGIQIENQLDFHLPHHVLLRRLPYHVELAAAIRDLTNVLKKTPPTESTGSPNASELAHLGQSLLQAAQQAHTIFGTPPPLYDTPSFTDPSEVPTTLPPLSFDRPPPPGFPPRAGQPTIRPPASPQRVFPYPPAPLQRVPLTSSTNDTTVDIPPTGVSTAPSVINYPRRSERIFLNSDPAIHPAAPAFSAVPTSMHPHPTFDPTIDAILGKISSNIDLSPTDLAYWHANVLPDFADTNYAEASAFSVVEQILNLNPDGTPLTRSKALRGPDKGVWIAAGIRELCKLFDTGTLRGAHLKDTNGKTPTYYNPVLKEKYKYDGPNGAARLERRVRGSAGGNLLFPTGPTSSNTAEIDVIKTFLNSVVSDNANFCTMDIRDFYLGTDMPTGDEEYMWIDSTHLTDQFIMDYNLQEFVVPFGKSYRILMKICKTIYGLKNAGRLSKNKLDNILLGSGYTENPNVPCLYTHASNGVVFVLVVDDFAVKYNNITGRDHLISTIKQANYELSVDATGSKFVGLTIHYNRNKRYMDISVPGYVKKLLTRFAHRNIRPCESPMVYTAPNYSDPSQSLKLPTDTSADLDAAGVLEAQQIIGCVLWYSRVVDVTTLTAVSKASTSLADKKASINALLDRLLGHLMKFPDNKVRYYASDMIIHSFSDLSYLSESKGRSRAGGVAFFGWHNKPERLNGPVITSSTILDVVVGSVSEGEYGAAYRMARQTAWLRIIAAAFGHEQPGPTTLHVDNSTAVGLANDTLKIARSKAIDMRFHWLRDRVRQGAIRVVYIPGERQLADFFTKALPVWQHLKQMTKFVRTNKADKPIA